MDLKGQTARWCSAALLALYGFMIAAPALVLLQFHADRSEIIRTLCVERSKPVEMNGCKGSCQLSKRLEAARTDGDGQEAPPRVELVEVLAVLNGRPVAFAIDRSHRGFPITRSELADGVRALPDPVPWCA